MTGHPDPHPERRGERPQLRVAGTAVADHVDGTGLEATLSPRPYLHPVRTLGGTTVTAAVPEDHRWHLGVCVAIQDVDKVNLWGGRTYVRGEGYRWLDDHGTVRLLRWETRATDGYVAELGWYGPDGACRLSERRSVWLRMVEPGLNCWALEFDFTLRNATGRPIELGSPATNGREGAGYGGFFWRLPASRTPVRVFTAEAEGEEAVHGTRAPWLATRGEAGDPYTLVFATADRRTGHDPWFVRVAAYPGVGSALAFTEPVSLEPEQALTRRIRVGVADGSLDRAGAERLARAVSRTPPAFPTPSAPERSTRG